jgi:hypothetical protein
MTPSKVFVPQAATAIFAGGVTTTVCTIEKLEQFAGDAIGSAIIRYPATNANNTVRRMGDSARIAIGGQTVFRGCVGHAPFEVSVDQDEVQLVLFDDKWRMGARKIGQQGIGTTGPEEARTGFTDVGYDTVFNRDGKPDKKVGDTDDDLDFSLASTAVYWTLRDVLKWVFKFYVRGDTAILPPAQVAHAAWDRKPSNLNLYGMSPVAAAQTLAQLAGESWALLPQAGYSTYRSVRPGSGTIRPLRLFAPTSRGNMAGVTEATVSDINAALSIQACRDKFLASSSEVVLERVYSRSNGMLLAPITSPVPGYAKRYRVDVTKYADNGLGPNRLAGSRPKVWRKQLVTRLALGETDMHYATAAEVAATPSLEAAESAEIPVWISVDGTVGGMKLLAGGYRIDVENSTLDIHEKLEVFADGDRTKKTELNGINWTVAGIWMTVATVLDGAEIAASADAALYLAEPVVEAVKRSDLVPERRYHSVLPKLTGDDPHAYDSFAVGAEEKYVDITARLNDALAAMADSSPEVESPITATLPLFPVWQLGDRVEIQGRPHGASGREVITRIAYSVYEDFTTQIEATNVMVAVEAEKFVGKIR